MWLEAYLDRYPELRADPEAVLGLIAAEYRFRLEREPDVAVESYLRRIAQFREKAVMPGGKRS